MAHRSTPTTLLFTGAALLATACGGGSNVSNASPRLDEVPVQTAAGATTFTLDLASYVSDREGATLTYSVTSGGGAFTGSSYSNVFDTMGTYEVAFAVTDGAKTTPGTFRVKVTSANLVVVREDNTGLLLLDSGTNALVRVTGASTTPLFAAGIDDGRVVYHRSTPSGNKLFAFDVLLRENTRIEPDEPNAVIYRATTADDRIVYSAGTSSDSALRIYNPRTGLSREITRGGVAALDVFVTDGDRIAYEIEANGDTDVFYYDSEEDDSFAIGTGDTDEQLLAKLNNGGIVFSRIGAGGETDLHYWRYGTGTVEIGSDVTALATRNKAFKVSGNGSQVVFSALNGTDEELFSWNPATGQTTTVASGSDFEYDALANGNQVVYREIVDGTRHDVFFFDLDDATTATILQNTGLNDVLGVTVDGGTSWAIVRRGNGTDVTAASLVSSPVLQTHAAGGATSTTAGFVANGDVVAQRSDGTALCVFDASAGTWGTPITGTGLQFAGDGLDAGDFVYSLTASSQTDLSMWDASATASVVVSDTAGDDVFQTLTADDTILFTRVVGTNTNADLFVWDGTDETRLTDEDAGGLRHDHTVLGKFAATR